MKLNPAVQISGLGRGPLARGHWLGAMVWLLVLCYSSWPCGAGLPEPYNLLYGVIEMNGSLAQAKDTSITVEARRLPTVGTIAKCALGDNPAAGNFYALKIRLESQGVTDVMTAADTGTILYITVLSNNIIKNQLPFTLGERGTVQRLDFGNVDADHNGLPDGWEQAYFGTNGVDPNADPDQDGLSNLQEYNLGTNPSEADAPHPADVNRDGQITIIELANYYNAWRFGKTWTIPPTNIAPEYVTRATYLWQRGGYYTFDTTVGTGPLWWVPAAAPSASAQSASGAAAEAPGTTRVAKAIGKTPNMLVVSHAPPCYIKGQVMFITNVVTLETNAQTYAVEHCPPPGWEIVSVLGGTYDTNNHKAKWGPFFDNTTRYLVYGVRALPSTSGTQTLDGRAAYDGHAAAVRGATIIELPAEAGASVLLPTAGLDKYLLLGKTNQTYSLEVSTNLRDWVETARTVTDASG